MKKKIMTNNKEQKQDVSENSMGIQAARDVTVITKGLSYTDVRDIALDVYKSNFYQLAGIAKEIASERAEEITADFLNKLQNENPEGLEKALDPDFQFALFTVQREYARNGDKELGDLLVDLLVDRSKHAQRDILQIVLNESLSIAPKLTESQLAALAIIFLFRYTQNFSIGNHITFGEYLDTHAAPYISKIVKNISCYQHLEFSGCGSIGFGSIGLEDILGNTYQGLFLKGFEEEEIKKKNINIDPNKNFYIRCLNDQSKIQINAINHDVINKKFEKYNYSEDDQKKIVELFNLNKMNENEIKTKCIEIRPYMKDLFDIWSGSEMQNFSLTSVGIAIGHANIKRFIGKFSDLSIWIN